MARAVDRNASLFILYLFSVIHLMVNLWNTFMCILSSCYVCYSVCVLSSAVNRSLAVRTHSAAQFVAQVRDSDRSMSE
jgi:hypothetical protein